MKIIFSPEYSGRVYVRPADCTTIMMDTIIVNTIGLINMLEFRLGLHYEDESEQQRVAHYYDAVSKYMAAHPDNVMSASFKVSSLSTAKSMLAWRDELRSAKWDFDGADISKRLATLIGVEKYYRKHESKDMSDRMRTVIQQIRLQTLDCKTMTIIMPFSKELLKPAIKTLIEELESHGAKTEQIKYASSTDSNLSKVRQLITSKHRGKITLDKDDDSIQIWKFADEYLACEYLSYNDMDDISLWVNADNKQMDDWLKLMSKSQTGSIASDSIPMLTQMLVIGLGIFTTPLNVNTLIEWLNLPIHPIDRNFRQSLAYTIANEGGYRNEACNNKIQQYIEGKYVYLDDKQKALPEDEQDKIRKKDIRKRTKQVSTYLPPQSASETIQTDKIRQFVKELSSWSRQRAHLMESEADNEQWVEQLMAVSDMCEALQILLDTIHEDTIDDKTIDSWLSTICEKGTYTNATAELGCRTVVDTPAKIATTADKVVWIGVDGDASQRQECAFLYPSEKKRLIEKHYVTPWAEEAQNAYHEHQMLTPLLMTNDRLILVVRDRIAGEPTPKHPLIVRLEQQVENFQDIVKYPHINADERHEAEPIRTTTNPSELQFDYADKIKWPDHLSPTSIGTLVEHPLDYMMESLLGIVNEGKAQMKDINTTKGNVAHAVIEALFAPRNEARYAKPEEIAARIKGEYESAYAKVLEAKGAVLQLTENKLEEKHFHEQLRTCLYTLLEILKDNNLKVTASETRVESQMGLGLPKAKDKDGKEKERDMLGYIDMTLEDKDGHPIVFDFKWTSRPDSYQTKLQENRSIQLELYRMMLSREKKDEVKRVAYFLMPKGHLYSQEKFEGRHCKQIAPENKDNIVEQLKQSVKYRMEQIKRGVVETNGTYDELQYVKDTETHRLFPLKKAKEDTKESNPFSKYKLFCN